MHSRPGSSPTRCHDTSPSPPRWGHQPVSPRAPKCRAFKRPPGTEDQVLEGHTGVTGPHQGPLPSSERIKAKAASRRPQAPRQGSSGCRAKPQGTGRTGSGGVLPCRHGARSSARGVATQTQGSQWETLKRPDSPAGGVSCLWPWQPPMALVPPQSEEAPEDPQTRESQQPLRDSQVHLFFSPVKPDSGSH